MTVSLWRIATDTPEYEANNLQGKGAEITGGRWNSKGKPVIYTSSNIALACLETIVHLNASSGLPFNRYLVEIKIPSAEWDARTKVSLKKLPIGWDAIPFGRASMAFGDHWLDAKSTMLLEIASVIVPEEKNVLINPRYPKISKVKAMKRRRWTYDGRLG